MDIENLVGDGLGRRRRRKGAKRRARRGGGAGCSAAGVKSNGRLRRGYRWAKGRKGCAIPARKLRRKRR